MKHKFKYHHAHNHFLVSYSELQNMTRNGSESMHDSICCSPSTKTKTLANNAQFEQKSSAYRTQQLPKDACTKSLEGFEEPLRQNRTVSSPIYLLDKQTRIFCQDMYNRSLTCCWPRKILSCRRPQSQRAFDPEETTLDTVRCLTFSEVTTSFFLTPLLTTISIHRDH